MNAITQQTEIQYKHKKKTIRNYFRLQLLLLLVVYSMSDVVSSTFGPFSPLLLWPARHFKVVTFQMMFVALVFILVFFKKCSFFIYLSNDFTHDKCLFGIFKLNIGTPILPVIYIFHMSIFGKRLSENCHLLQCLTNCLIQLRAADLLISSANLG